MDRNIELLQKVYDQITMYPESHKQEDWISGYVPKGPLVGVEKVAVDCKTGACVCGWAALLEDNTNPLKHLTTGGDENELSSYWPVGERTWSELGSALLGLDRKESDTLFREKLSRDSVLSGLKAAISGEDIREAVWECCEHSYDPNSYYDICTKCAFPKIRRPRQNTNHGVE